MMKSFEKFLESRYGAEPSYVLRRRRFVLDLHTWYFPWATLEVVEQAVEAIEVVARAAELDGGGGVEGLEGGGGGDGGSGQVSVAGGE